MRRTHVRTLLCMFSLCTFEQLASAICLGSLLSAMAPKAKAKGQRSGPRTAHRWVVRYDDPDWAPPAAHGVLRGIISQPEVGGGSHRYHTQAYVECVGVPSNRQVAEHLNIPWVGKGKTREHSLHLEPAFGTREENFAYCGSSKYCRAHKKGDMKFSDGGLVADDTFCDCEAAAEKGQLAPPTITGQWPSIEGGASSQAAYKAMMDDVKAGKGIMEIRRVHADAYTRFRGGVDKVVQAHRPQRKWMPRVYWLWGEAGANKSRMAHAVLTGGTYFKPPDSRWFDGYDGHDVLVLNDLRNSTFTFSYLLDLLDRYDFQVQVKGGYTPMLAKVIVIICSKSHADLWAELGGTHNENLKQLTRRIYKELHVTHDNVAEQKTVVTSMRQSLLDMRDPANWDNVGMFGEWDGTGAVPSIAGSSRGRSRSPRRLKKHDDTEPQAKKKPPQYIFKGMPVPHSESPFAFEE